jgi:hypothetical protein
MNTRDADVYIRGLGLGVPELGGMAIEIQVGILRWNAMVGIHTLFPYSARTLQRVSHIGPTFDGAIAANGSNPNLCLSAIKRISPRKQHHLLCCNAHPLSGGEDSLCEANATFLSSVTLVVRELQHCYSLDNSPFDRTLRECIASSRRMGQIASVLWSRVRKMAAPLLHDDQLFIDYLFVTCENEILNVPSYILTNALVTVGSYCLPLCVTCRIEIKWITF